MHNEGSVDVIGYDASLKEGGKISASKKSKSDPSNNSQNEKKGLIILEGGPEILLENPEINDRTLFLCYPDEDVDQSCGSEQHMSMAAACLEHYTGDTIIHVGELFSDTLSLDHSPWGRSTGKVFQERLGIEFHCILRMKLENNWLHVNDFLTVWKRSLTCCMVFQGSDEEDGDEEEVEYKYIPPEEVLSVDAAAPCVAHLLKKKFDAVKSQELNDSNNADRKRKRNDEVSQHNELAGNAW